MNTNGDLIIAPWSAEQVEALNLFQKYGRFHPFTCSRGHGRLTATTGRLALRPLRLRAELGARVHDRTRGPLVSDWTPEDLAAEQERRAEVEADGICPDSGYKIAKCWRTICDCAYAPPVKCAHCRVKVWDMVDHLRRRHDPTRKRSA